MNTIVRSPFSPSFAINRKLGYPYTGELNSIFPHYFKLGSVTKGWIYIIEISTIEVKAEGRKISSVIVFKIAAIAADLDKSMICRRHDIKSLFLAFNRPGRINCF